MEEGKGGEVRGRKKRKKRVEKRKHEVFFSLAWEIFLGGSA